MVTFSNKEKLERLKLSEETFKIDTADVEKMFLKMMHKVFTYQMSEWLN